MARNKFYFTYLLLTYLLLSRSDADIIADMSHIVHG